MNIFIIIILILLVVLILNMFKDETPEEESVKIDTINEENLINKDECVCDWVRKAKNHEIRSGYCRKHNTSWM